MTDSQPRDKHDSLTGEIMPIAGEGSRFLKEGKTTPKQMGNDKWPMTNIEDSISNLQFPISK